MKSLLGKRKVMKVWIEGRVDGRKEEKKEGWREVEKKEGKKEERGREEGKRKINLCVSGKCTLYLQLTVFSIVFIKKQTECR